MHIMTFSERPHCYVGGDQALRGKLGYVCPGFYAVCSRNDVNCRSVCAPAAISHTW